MSSVAGFNSASKSAPSLASSSAPSLALSRRARRREKQLEASGLRVMKSLKARGYTKDRILLQANNIFYYWAPKCQGDSGVLRSGDREPLKMGSKLMLRILGKYNESYEKTLSLYGEKFLESITENRGDSTVKEVKARVCNQRNWKDRKRRQLAQERASAVANLFAGLKFDDETATRDVKCGIADSTDG